MLVAFAWRLEFCSPGGGVSVGDFGGCGDCVLLGVDSVCCRFWPFVAGLVVSLDWLGFWIVILLVYVDWFACCVVVWF